MSLGPTLFDDVDGRYRGMDNQVHTLKTGERNFSTFSLWDTFRAAHPAYTLIEQEHVPLWMNTLIRMAEQSPAGMPVWPLMSTETGTMTGYHSAAVISEACNKGFTGIDYEKAYALMMKRAMVDDYRGLGYYRKLHYIPADKESESVSKTFEYCYDDWAIAHVARKLGKSSDAEMLVKRSTNYRNYFDKSVGFMRPKLEDGCVDLAVPADRHGALEEVAGLHGVQRLADDLRRAARCGRIDSALRRTRAVRHEAGRALQCAERSA